VQPRETDADAIRRSLRAPEAFRIVFERHFEPVHRYAQQRSGLDADEVAAETFVRAFAARARYDLRRPDARPWLLGIATRVMLGRWERERRARTAMNGAAGVAAAEPEARALPRAVAVALAALRPDDRETLLLLAWADLSYEQIASALDVPVGTVRSRISRARRLLRARLAETSTPEGSRRV